MAKVVLPLLSAEARGKIADSIVFFPLAHCVGGQPVRRWLKPHNPQSTGQGDSRIQTAAAGTVVSKVQRYNAKLATVDKDLAVQIKAVTPATKIWNAYYVERMLGSAFATITAALSAYSAGGTTMQGSFGTAGTALALETSTISYSTIGTITAGEKVFIAAYAAYLMSLDCAPVTPGSMSAAQITAFAKAFTSLTP